MRKWDIFLCVCFCLALFWGAWLLFFWGAPNDPAGGVSQVSGGVALTEPADRVGEIEAAAENAPRLQVAPPEDTEGEEAAYQEETDEPDIAVQYPEGLEGIKQQIYDINVEYIEDLEKLDALGRVTDQPPEVLWEGEWASADDWKRRGDGFRIAQKEDGGYAFFPDGDTSRSYDWDEEKGEFSWDLDYYGKIISHKARFIDEDVLVLMKISGRKVALDIYRKNE